MANESVSTTNIWPNYSKENVQKAAAASKKESDSATMGKDQFMTILIAQLKNQDPLSPMDNSQFTAQMAQFSSLEQLMNMSTQLTQMNASMGTASQLIGQKITWYDTETKNYLTGDVTSVLQKDGKMFAAVDSYLVPVNDITVIEKADAGNKTPTTDSTDKAATQAAAQSASAPETKSDAAQTSQEEAASTTESGDSGGVK
ncbi:flagellar hook capping protein [Saccharibacillus sp. O23]|uniref:flagellar hook capping FlgD N-terminal domain-containing protein n=1 Tax=Saccharibacillus sp. O23 TaxID=2009338 RepID=UPI000B4E49F6|nr:flagellar hook capping FlgD N-terminal domain-containing protein [Saccharibacillus sp. O23]OWR27848.1 flagellar hook capping protein [Saccharibacillus sp. O23]